MLGIGLMSGTSLDGVDAALVEFKDEQVMLLHFVTKPYTAELKERIFRNLFDQTANLSQISSLNFELGQEFVQAIDLLLAQTPYTYEDIAFVASHGQTIWHDPNAAIPHTFQIGEASVIAYQTNIPVISNFRVMDVASGGQGAPLVPFSEFYQFRSENQSIALQNIGGISNVTYLPKAAKLEDVLSFDCGPGNVMIDYFMKKYFLLPYDEGGKTAFQGRINTDLLRFLMADPYLSKKPPKSTGREQYNMHMMEELALRFDFNKLQKEDVIATITAFTADAIVDSYHRFLPTPDQVIVCGGGSHNEFILARMREQMSSPIKKGEEVGINSDAKEAVAFAVLGYRTFCHLPSNVKEATGAKEDVILGQITLSPRKKHEFRH